MEINNSFKPIQQLCSKAEKLVFNNKLPVEAKRPVKGSFLGGWASDIRTVSDTFQKH